MSFEIQFISDEITSVLLLQNIRAANEYPWGTLLWGPSGDGCQTDREYLRKMYSHGQL